MSHRISKRGMALVVMLLSLSASLALTSYPVDDQAHPPAQTDQPDEFGFDSNGDGIDGMRLGPVFVSFSTGSDSNPGTIDLPMESLNAAILAARQLRPVRDIYVSTDAQFASIVLQDGVSIYGGFDAANGWTRGSQVTEVYGDSVAAWATNLTVPVTLSHLLVHAGNNLTTGGLSIGVLQQDSAALLTLERCIVQSSNGGTGASGANGGKGLNGINGVPGSPGSCDSNTVGGAGGPGGAGFASNSGGNGGKGGDFGNHSGASGNTGAGSAGGFGGFPGSGGDPGFNGGSGGIGGSGSNGGSGSPGSDFYAVGGAGAAGSNGSGGGGGGGGGGQGCTFCDDGPGNGGGGGGGGATGGDGGGGGGFGGASVGILTINSLLSVLNGSVESSHGGRGGKGGAGGAGGVGGAGNIGANACPGEVGGGGSGGPGGNGGAGGAGAGGRGGHSIAILSEAGSVVETSATLVNLAGGAGGVGPGPTGSTGIGVGFHTRVERTSIVPRITPLSTHAVVYCEIDTASSGVTPLVACADSSRAYLFTIIVPPAHGTASVVANQLVYTPEAGYTGIDVFRYHAAQISSVLSVDGYAEVFVSGTHNAAGDWDRYR